MFRIWRIDRLKADLAKSSLSAEAGLRYLIAIAVLATAESYVISPVSSAPFNALDHMMSGALLLVFVLGTAACYAANRAAQGIDFLARYVALAWVLGIRWLLLVAIPMIGLVLATEDYLGEIPRETSPFEAVSALVVFVAFYWRLRHHFSELNTKSAC